MLQQRKHVHFALAGAALWIFLAAGHDDVYAQTPTSQASQPATLPEGQSSDPQRFWGRWVNDERSDEDETDLHDNRGHGHGDGSRSARGSALRHQAFLSIPAIVTVLERDELDTIGEFSIGDTLQRRLLLQSNASNSQDSLSRDGATLINLRGLGAQRTLILLNGHRLAASSNGILADTQSGVDLNAIPKLIIDRVEVLPDIGASVYGSGAMGGTINLVTREGFTGIETSAGLHSAQDGRGSVYDLGLLFGYPLPQGSLQFAANYFHQHGLYADKRDFGRYNYGYNWNSGEEFAQGSSATPSGTLFVGRNAPGNTQWDRLMETCTTGTCISDDNGDTWRDYDASGVDDIHLPIDSRGDAYREQPATYVQIPYRNYSAFLSGTHKVASDWTAFFEALYNRRHSAQELSPNELSTSEQRLVISADNIYNPFSRDIYDFRRRLVELGNRRLSHDTDTMRVIAGLTGQFDVNVPVLSDWRWELSVNFGRIRRETRNEQSIDWAHVAQALGPNYYDADGNVRCGTLVQPENPRCVPLNLFGGGDSAFGSSLTSDMLNWITYNAVDIQTNQQRQINGHTGGTFNLPLLGQVRAQIGVAHRSEHGSVRPVSSPANADSDSDRESQYERHYQVTQGFVEASATPVYLHPYSSQLEIHAAMGAFHYKNAGWLSKSQLSLAWHMGAGVTLFSQRVQSFREPSITELYAEELGNMTQATDPCDTSTGTHSPELAQRCESHGVPGHHIDTRPGLTALVRGHSNLREENALTWNIGVEYRPLMLSELYVALRYFHSDMSQLIQPTDIASIFNDCYEGNIDSACVLIRRNDTGFISGVDSELDNTGRLTTNGVDFNLRYDLDTKSSGHLRFDLEGVWLGRYVMKTGSARGQDGAGFYDLGHFPKWRGRIAGVWQLARWRVGMNVHYVGTIAECADNDCDAVNDPRRLGLHRMRQVGSHTTADLWFSTTDLGPTRLTLLLGVNNLANTSPAKLYNGPNVNSDSTAYDFLGRQVYVRIGQRF